MTADLNELRRTMRGHLVDEDDPTYAERRRLYNGMIDKRPLAIASCADVEDVPAAIRWAVSRGVRLVVRGGGHNGAGLGSIDGGLVIDLAALNDVEVDAQQRTVRVGGGARLADIDAATAAFGLAVPTGFMSTTGIGGLTLGGGSGYLTRAHGLTIDNLLQARVVLADGSVVTASEAAHPDLFWALRGGGGNFGAVVSFVFRAHPVADVFGGPVFWDIGDAAAVLRAYRDLLPQTPERLSVFAGLKTVPVSDPFPTEHQGKTVAALIACFDGSEADGRAAMEPIMRELPPPLFDWRSQQPFTQIQQLFDGLMPPGMQWYWRGDFVDELPDNAIAVHLDHARRLRPGSQSVMHLYPIDGAVHRVAEDATAWRRRSSRWSMVIAGISSDAAEAAAVTRWAREYHDDVHRFSARGGYLNFMMADDLLPSAGRVQETYGDNLPRLAAIKERYDPHDVFAVTDLGPTAPHAAVADSSRAGAVTDA